MHLPPTPQALPAAQTPQVPPQPSGPHSLSVHWRVQPSHTPVAALQVPEVQVPHWPPQPSGPQLLPSQARAQPSHWPVAALQVPEVQVPQVPPQPSEPHVLPPQFGRQQTCEELHTSSLEQGHGWPQPSSLQRPDWQLGVQPTQVPLTQVAVPQQGTPSRQLVPDGMHSPSGVHRWAFVTQ